MPVRRLPSNPNLDHLKYQAKDLLKEHAARDAGAAQRIREFHPRFRRAPDAEIFAAELKLSDAQLTIARESGFPSWARLKRHIEKPTLIDQLNLPHHQRIEDPVFRRAVDLIDAGDVAGLRAYLKQHTKLVHQHVAFEGWNYFHSPTLLEFVAENPVRHGKLPANIVDIAKVILDAAPAQSELDETLGLVATGSVPRECRMQLPLIDLLCGHGADPDSALHAATLHGELEAAHALITRGARIDLPVAAALGRTEDFRRLLPDAGKDDRHLALALAAQFGHVEIVRLLLDAGEDPNRYNPIGGHSHSTPLHQAAAAGNEDMARLLVERGARLDMKDILWHGTPAGWAAHEGKSQVEAYLRAAEARRPQK
jgi:Ankyrin repeats (3 copies)